MLRLNCELKGKCENYESVNCYHCVNNLDLPFINNYKEKKNDLSKSLKESFDKENSLGVMRTIDDKILNILLKCKYDIDPESKQGLMVKEKVKELLCDKSNVFDTLANLIPVNGIDYATDIVQFLDKNELSFETISKDDEWKETKKMLNSTYGYFAQRNNDNFLDSLRQYFDSAEKNIFNK